MLVIVEEEEENRNDDFGTTSPNTNDDDFILVKKKKKRAGRARVSWRADVVQNVRMTRLKDTVKFKRIVSESFSRNNSVSRAKV